MIPIHIDFETRSAVDLKKATTHVYALDPSTDVWCMAYAIGEGGIKLWVNGDPFPQDILDMASSGKPYYFIAHNAHFELTIWNLLCVPRYGWPRLPVERTYCTMAMAYAMALPGSLENAANSLALPVEKDLKGRVLMVQMASPRRRNEDGTFTWWDDEARRTRLYDYCKRDVEVERALEHRLKPLSDNERKVWLHDWQVNQRGVKVDLEAIVKAMTTIDSEKKRLNDRIYEASGKQVKGISDIIGMTNALEILGVRADEGLAKADIRGLLQDKTMHPAAREILLLRQEGAKSSTAKLKAMIEGSSLDGRIRGIIQYHGAGTGRFAGRKLQPQNLPRGELGLSEDEIEDVIAHIDEPNYLSAFYGPPLTVISDAIRSLIIADEGHDFIAADFSAIEARVLAWLAGQQSVLDIFLRGEDIYKHAAAQIFGVDIKEVTKAMRQVGKTAILALGYQGGVGAFLTMAAAYGVDMSVAYEPLLAAATEKQLAGAQSLYRRYVFKHCEAAKELMLTVPQAQRSDARAAMPLERLIALGNADPALPSYEVYIASDLTKRLWREANPDICEYWFNLEAAAMAAIRTPKTVYEVKIPGVLTHRHVRFIKSGSFLWCRLPSGRRLCYPFPTIQERKPTWADEDDTDTKPTIIYMGVDSKTRSWGEQIAYGGLLAENVTQAVARDFLVEAMFSAEDAGYPVTFHVHDELVCEVPKDFGSVKELETIITTPPVWGFDCPIAAEGWRGERYRK